MSNLSQSVINLVTQFRPPFSRSATLLYAYTAEGSVNLGITVQLAAGESAIAPATGTVSRIWTSLPEFYTEDPVLLATYATNVTIDCGLGVLVTLSGLASTGLVTGQPVTRGALVGPPKTSQIWMGVLVGTVPLDPLRLNPTFLVQDGAEVLGQYDMIRFAPDVLPRDLSGGTAATLVGGKRYFTPDATQLLVNVDFNGTGLKQGPAQVGKTASDYWNVYTPASYTATVDHTCGYGYGYGWVFSSAPLIPLLNYDRSLSVVYLERVAPLTSAAGTQSTFDPMLNTYAGGPSVPNTFNLRNIPPGSYTLYVYSAAASGTSSVYIGVNGGAPVLHTVNNTAATSFVAGQNYVAVSAAVNSTGKMSFAVYGYLSGLQLLRTGS